MNSHQNHSQSLVENLYLLRQPTPKSSFPSALIPYKATTKHCLLFRYAPRMNIMISHSPRLPTRWYLHIYQDHIHSNNRNKSTSIDYTSIYDGVVCACLQCVFAFTPLITYQEVCPNTLLLFAVAPTLGLIAYYTHTAHDLEPAPSTAKVPKRLFSLS